MLFVHRRMFLLAMHLICIYDSFNAKINLMPKVHQNQPNKEEMTLENGLLQYYGLP